MNQHPDRKEDMRACAEIVVEALRAALREVATLATNPKKAGEACGVSYATSADDKASELAKKLVGERFGKKYIYYDEEMADREANAGGGTADGTGLAKEKIDGHPFVALGDPVDGTNAIKKTHRRLQSLGAQWTDGDWVDQYSSTLVLWESRKPVISAIATARGHVFVSDGTTIQLARFDMRSGLWPGALQRWELPNQSMGDEYNKFLALLGAIEDLQPAWLIRARQRYHCQRLGHFATDFIELMCGTVDAFISGREKIWDYCVALPFVAASGGKLVTNEFVFGYEAATPIWIAWKSQTERIREIIDG